MQQQKDGISDVYKRQELTLSVAHAIQATPVITTATDVNGLFSIDSWASRHHLFISNMKIAKEISARLLRGEPVGMTADWFVLPQLPKGFTADSASCLLYTSYRQI